MNRINCGTEIKLVKLKFFDDVLKDCEYKYEEVLPIAEGSFEISSSIYTKVPVEKLTVPLLLDGYDGPDAFGVGLSHSAHVTLLNCLIKPFLFREPMEEEFKKQKPKLYKEIVAKHKKFIEEEK